MNLSFSLSRIINLAGPVRVVDIGANPIDGDPPYKPLLDKELANLVGFEPQPEALAELNRKKGPRETYLPHTVGDGGRHTLHITRAPGMTSLLEPNPELLAHFHGFPEWGRVERTEEVETRRLDDLTEIDGIDYLKIDIQGAELMAFENGIERLKECLVIHTEVEFLPMYKEQPLFAEVERFLREQGFLFHRFSPLTSRALRPFLVNNDIYQGLSQVFWADAVFVRDFTRLESLSDEQCLKAALICHDLYGSADLVVRLLMEVDRRTGSGHVQTYMQALAAPPASPA